MKKIFLFLIICTAIFQLSATLQDDTKEEWIKFLNSNLAIEDIPGFSEELLLLPTTGQLCNPMFMKDTYSFVISPEYIRRLQPLIEFYTAEHSPVVISQRFSAPLSNSFFNHIFLTGGAPNVEIFSKDEVNALRVFGIDAKEAINLSAKSHYDFYVKELYTSFSRNFKSYRLRIESPDLDGLRESVNLPKKDYTIFLLVQELPTVLN